MTELFNQQHFTTPITLTQMVSFINNNKLRNGLKGKKGHCPPGCEKGWFKAGSKPANSRPIGSERICANGYVKVKVSNTKKPVQRRWRCKHLVVWEAANGKVPKGHAVLFADGNRLNVELSNLLLVTRAELLVMSRNALISSCGELTRIGKTIADIKMRINERKAQYKEGKK